ncbi:TPA: hypothetical protein HA318_03565 [Candidatus Micrarchaeota archaeon]|nr:MAG: hypothetical protein AUJ65_03610 [Candidatus Micrarchaeota archaeon CG1_02_51_15]HII39052.1 hypothetical protein [Candidatus Micrarchaeota archaeon]
MVNLVLDSSSLISLSETCNIDCLYFFQHHSRALFIVPPSVYQEIIANPLKISCFEFSAVRLRKVVEDGVAIEATAFELKKRTREVMAAVNNCVRVNDKPLALLHEGEAQCLAAYWVFDVIALAIDEKTTRLLVENPQKLVQILKEERVGELEVDEKALARFKEVTFGVKIIRSVELIAVAAEKGFFRQYKQFENQAFHAALLAMRRAGCSLTDKELKEYIEVNV